MIERPDTTEFAPFYAGCVALVHEADVIRVLEDQNAVLQRAGSAES
jgi:hypothetical protein